jgi:transcriptional regulator with XRE-family HTH domain
MGPGQLHRLAEVREKRQVRQTDLARQIGMSRQQLSNIEAGRREISLTDLRKAAGALGVHTVDLLLPEDAPNYPSGEESVTLKMLRDSGHDAMAVLAAVESVLGAFERIRETAERPRDLSGDPALTRKLATTWNNLSDDQRARTLAMLDHAREFSRD